MSQLVEADTRPVKSERYALRSRLGLGDNGIVYRALDREMDREVALKTLTANDAEQVFRLKAEFRALSEIAHPNLIQLHELVVGDEDCFFTMELLEGGTLTEFLRPAREDGPLDDAAIDRLERVAAQLVAGISALHHHRRLHRDIKPTNVIVTTDGRAVLVDFGFCADLGRSSRDAGAFVGTLRYMAPEQAWGQPLTPAADWYAFGVLLYEALFGRPPFDAVGTALITQKQRAPKLPDHVNPRARRLAELAIALMAPEPGKRPTVATLRSALRLDDAEAHDSQELPFVGRERERALLESAWQEACAGRPASASVHGVSGIGKTELVDRFLRDVETATPEAVVLRGKCHPREAVAYTGFDGIVDDLSDWLASLSSARRAALLVPDISAVAAMFPVLTRVPGIVRELDEEPDPHLLRQRAFRALHALLETIGKTHPLVVFLDDAHWGDVDTAALLIELSRPSASRMLVILAYRSEEETSPFLTIIRERAPDLLSPNRQAQLGPVDAAASADIARWALRDEDGASMAEELVRAAGGHPFFLRELALAAVSGGRVAQTDLPSLLTARIDRLPDLEHRLLDLASMAGRPVPRRIVLAAAGCFEQGRPAVFRLVRQRLLRDTFASGEPAIEPYHAHVRQAAVNGLALDARRGCHRALADSLLQEPTPDADLLVDVLLGAEDRAGAERFAAIAADRAEQQLAFDRAATLHRTVVDLACTRGALPAERARLRARLARALATAGHSREAGEAFALAAEDARKEGSALAADLERDAAEHLLRGGHFEQGVTRLRRVLEAAGARYPTTASRAFVSVLVNRARLAVRGMEYEPRDVSAISARDLARMDAYWSAGVGLTWIDRTRTADFQARHMLLALTAGDTTRVARGLGSEASQLAAMGGSKRVERARQIMADVRRHLDPHPDPTMRAFAFLLEGSMEFYGSGWRRAVELNERAIDILHEARSPSEWERTTSHTLTLASLVYLGQLKTLRARQTLLLDEARERGNRVTSSCLSSGPANLSWLVAGDPEQAERRAEEALAPWKKDDFQLAHYLHLVAMTNVDLYRGDGARAMARLRTEWPRVVASMSLHVQNFRVTLRHLRGRAALMLAGQTRSRLERYRLMRRVHADATALASDDVAWARPLALVLEGGIAAREHATARAAERFGAASIAFEALDMKLHASAARLARGQLLGGSIGAADVAAATAWMASEDVVDPVRLAAGINGGISAGA